MVTAYVYVISHPSRPREGYIGKTINLRARWRQHWGSARRETAPLYEWWRSLASAPSLAVIESKAFEARTEADAWSLAREVKLIAHARALGFSLLNANAGGRGSRAPLPSTRAKMSAWVRQRPMREKVSAARRQHGRGIDIVRGAWRARLWVDGRRINLGTFATEHEARAVRTAAEIQHWGRA